MATLRQQLEADPIYQAATPEQQADFRAQLADLVVGQAQLKGGDEGMLSIQRVGRFFIVHAQASVTMRHKSVWVLQDGMPSKLWGRTRRSDDYSPPTDEPDP